MRSWRLGLLVCLVLACSSRSQTPAKPRKISNKFTPPKSALAQAAIKAYRPALATVPNEIVVQNLTDAAQTRRPFTISRYFAQGEIAKCPQAVVSGQALESQCDVKTRWEDGSVRHALITYSADLPAGGFSRVTFRDQDPPADAKPLSKQQMLDFNGGDWGAGMGVGANVEDRSEAVFINAKDMLGAWNGTESDLGIRYWLKGPLVTQVIVEDKERLKYDFGWSQQIQPVVLGDYVKPDAIDIVMRPESAGPAAAWPMPALVHLDSELIEICQVQGSHLRVCPLGRRKNGSSFNGDHRPGAFIAPAWGWKKAADDAHKSLHPIFVLTFYRDYPGVKVEYILENTWTNKMQTQVYDVQLRAGRDLAPVGNAQTMVHWPASRWRQVGWSGAEPGGIHIDHNFAYLIYARALPSYDLTKHIPASQVNNELDQFLATDRGVGMGSGQWFQAFEAPGSRGDIAMIPEWYLFYLYTADPRLWDLIAGNAEAGAHVPIHYRESTTNRAFCPISCDSSPPAVGRVLSIETRPTIYIPIYNFDDTKAEDRTVPVGTITHGGWTPDIAHQPSFAYIPYLLTGDWYFLEELHFWGSWNMGACSNPGYTCDYCRHADWGQITQEVRSRAWGLRSLAYAAMMTPDGMPEKTYFTNKLNNNIAVDEGFFNITTGSFYEPCPAGPYDAVNTTRWCWGWNTMTVPQLTGKTNLFYSYERVAGDANIPDPYLWTQRDFPKNPPSQQLGASWAKPVYSVGSEWMSHYHLTVTGHLLELGFTQIAELHARRSTRILHEIKDPNYNPYLVAVYRTPEFRCNPKLDSRTNQFMCQADGRFTSWADMRDAYKERADVPPDNFVWRSMDQFFQGHLDNPAGSYPYLARSAASFLPGIDADGLSGKEAWDWINPKLPANRLAENPVWALVPRAENDLLAAYKSHTIVKPSAPRLAKKDRRR